MRPLNENVIIRVNKAADRVGSIFIPENSKEKPQRGKIVSVGTDIKLITVGDEVIFNRYGGQEIEENGEILLIIKEKEILAVIEQL